MLIVADFYDHGCIFYLNSKASFKKIELYLNKWYRDINGNYLKLIQKCTDINSTSTYNNKFRYFMEMI